MRQISPIGSRVVCDPGSYLCWTFGIEHQIKCATNKHTHTHTIHMPAIFYIDISCFRTQTHTHTHTHTMSHIVVVGQQPLGTTIYRDQMRLFPCLTKTHRRISDASQNSTQCVRTVCRLRRSFMLHALFIRIYRV